MLCMFPSNQICDGLVKRTRLYANTHKETPTDPYAVMYTHPHTHTLSHIRAKNNTHTHTHAHIHEKLSNCSPVKEDLLCSFSMFIIVFLGSTGIDFHASMFQFQVYCFQILYISV